LAPSVGAAGVGNPLGGVGVGFGGVAWAIATNGKAMAKTINKTIFFMINNYSVSC
jgi:hypothetical protein